MPYAEPHVSALASARDPERRVIGANPFARPSAPGARVGQATPQRPGSNVFGALLDRFPARTEPRNLFVAPPERRASGARGAPRLARGQARNGLGGWFRGRKHGLQAVLPGSGSKKTRMQEKQG